MERVIVEIPIGGTITTVRMRIGMSCVGKVILKTYLGGVKMRDKNRKFRRFTNFDTMSIDESALIFQKRRERMKLSIPQGYYCYSYLGFDEENGFPIFHYCPWYGVDKTKEDQDCGYCHYLGIGDWQMKGAGLLWDSVKECGINKRINLNYLEDF